ncbi:hypothetical protein U1Q18_035018 [Sarracenia purpurea var. burkii]
MNWRFATVDGGGSRRGEAGGGNDCAERRRGRGRVGSEGGEPPRRRRNLKIQICARNCKTTMADPKIQSFERSGGG